MGYYLGDYYRGDYYRGDPGLLGSLARGALKVAGAIGLPGAGLASTLVGAIPVKRPGFRLPQIPRPFQIPFGQPSPVTGPAFGPERAGRAARVCMRRHPCTGQPMVVKCPRMNPGNARALRRAIRREKAFIGLARRALKGTGISVGRRPAFARKKVGRR